MCYKFEGIAAEKIKNGESIRGNLKYGQAVKLSATSIMYD